MIQGRIAGILAVLLTLLASACAGPPQPFQPATKGGNELLTLPDRTGVAVTPVTGAVPAGGTDLAAAMAEALRKQNVPASVGSGNRNVRWLMGHAEFDPTRESLNLSWSLFDAAGARIGGHKHTHRFPESVWQQGDPQTLKTAVQPGARRIAGLIQKRNADSERALAGYPEGTRVVVEPLSGDPAKATRALAKAMVRQLRQRNLPLADRPQRGDVVITGTLTLGESNGTNRLLDLVWIVRRKGQETRLGDLQQSNRVPDAQIARGWSRLANLITRAATPGVLQVLKAKAPTS